MKNLIICGSLGSSRKITADELLQIAVQNGMKIVVTSENDKEKGVPSTKHHR